MKKPVLFLLLMLFVTACFAQPAQIMNVIYPDTPAKKKALELKGASVFRLGYNKILDSSWSRSTKSIGQKTYTPVVSSSSPFINQNANIGLESQFGETFASASIGSTGKNTSWGIEVKQPFKTKPNAVSPLSLDGLDNGASVKFSFQRNFKRLKSQAQIASIYQKVKTEFYRRRFRSIPCSTLVTKTNGTKTEYFYKGGTTEQKIDSLIKTGCCCNQSDQFSVQASFVDASPLSTLDQNAIDAIGFDDLDEATQSDFVDKVYTKRWFLGASAAIAKTSFDYITDPSSITPVLGEKHINKSFKLNVGYIIQPDDKEKLSVLAFTYSYSPGYEASDESADITYPVGAQGLLYSKTVTIGKPTATSNMRVALEYRKQWRASSKFPVAISPSVSYLFDQHTLSMILPIYLFQSKKDEKFTGLQGGFRLAYKTTTIGSGLTPFAQGFGASVFIAAPFDMFSF